MKILIAPRFVQSDGDLLYIDDTAMDPSQARKRKLSPSPVAPDNVSSIDSSDPSSRKLRGRKRKHKVAEKVLGEDYQPNSEDVICGRGKEAQNHVSVAFGNIDKTSIECKGASLTVAFYP